MVSSLASLMQAYLEMLVLDLEMTLLSSAPSKKWMQVQAPFWAPASVC